MTTPDADLTSNCSADGGPALAAAVCERDCARRAPAARCPRDVEQASSQDVMVEQPAVQRGIEAHDRGFVRRRTGQVQGSPDDGGHRHAVDLLHLVVPQSGDVADEDPAAAVPGGRAARDVHAIERNVPQGQSVQHGRGLMAHDGRLAQSTGCRPDKEAVHRCCVVRQNAVDVSPLRSRPSSPTRTSRPNSSSDQPSRTASRRSRSSGGGAAASVTSRRSRAHHSQDRGAAFRWTDRSPVDDGYWSVVRGCGLLLNP